MPGAADEVPSELVAEKYRLTRLLGRGGMGSVWEGLHTSLGTRVAVKFIDAAYAEDEEARNRFRNEARAAATLRSKHVVQVYDHGVSDDGRPYIVMEFLSGEPLDKRLDRVGRLSLPDTANIIMQTCRALSKAHDAGIVHRDLKPENVFLVWDDEDQADIAKVVDFGIAKFTDPSLGASSATRTGSVLGTPYYMSPEQARGLRSVDYRSDLWSIGVIAYRCVVGSLPFEGEAIGDVLVKICTAPLPVPSTLVAGVPPTFDAWFARALAREPENRFGNARELADELMAASGLSQRLPMSSIVDPSSPHQAAPSNAEWSTARTQAAVVTPGIGGLTPPPAALTGAPTTQTPAPPGKSRVGLVVALAVAGVLVLGVGSAVAYKLGKSPAAPAKASGPEPSASIAVAVPSAGPAPNALPPTASAKPAVEPVPSASVAEKPSVAPPPATARRPAAAPHRHATVKPHAAATHKSGGSTGKIELGY
jgi:serine/threonine-protein kinase